MDRNSRQKLSLDKWLQRNSRGTIEAATAYGKTRVGLNALTMLRRKDSSRTAIIVVPTIVLKSQWENQLNEWGLMENTQVYVINSLIKLTTVNCKFLIIDECHRYAAKTFSKIFEVAKYTFILGLTATMKRLDGKHTLIQKYAPIVDTISLAYCRAKGYVSQYKEYNLGINLPQADLIYYQDKARELGSMMDKFDNDFQTMLKCSYSNKPQWSSATHNWFAPHTVIHAQLLGWRGNTVQSAREILELNASRPRGQKLSVWGGATNEYFHPDKLHGFAVYGMRLTREIKDFINKHPLKVQNALELINKTNYETITFSENTEVADDMKSVLGDRAVVYHSNLESNVEEIEVVKTYKREESALNFIANNAGWAYKGETDGIHTVGCIKERKVSAKRLKEEAISKIMNDGTVKVMLTAKALDQGFDYPGAELGIIMSRTSNPTQQIQRTGRVVRKHTYDDGTEKVGLVVNLYLKDTRDFRKLRGAQKSSVGAMDVSSVDEILTREGLK